MEIKKEQYYKHKISNEVLKVIEVTNKKVFFSNDVFTFLDRFHEFWELVDEAEQEKGYKESSEKLEYELDWDFIKQVAERMSTNKGKYSAYNWKKSMDVEKLKQSLFRHVLEVMNGNYKDEEREYGHLEALVCNAMFINYQLKK